MTLHSMVSSMDSMEKLVASIIFISLATVIVRLLFDSIGTG
jgi:hypothetical protein